MKDYKQWTAKERNRSLYLTKKAMGLGLLERPQKCSQCGRNEGLIEFHCTDYDVRLQYLPKILNGTATEQEIQAVKDSAVELCKSCHTKLHIRYIRAKKE